MKVIKVLPIFMCMIALFVFGACENTDQHASILTDKIQIDPRTVDDCEDCPVDYCCCTILSLEITTIDISVCGFSNGDYLCGVYTPGGNCSQFSGIGEDITFTPPSNLRVYLCKEKNGVFSIFNAESFTVSVRLSCQVDITNPQFININIPAHSFVFFSTNSDCELEQC